MLKRLKILFIISVFSIFSSIFAAQSIRLDQVQELPIEELKQTIESFNQVNISFYIENISQTQNVIFTIIEGRHFIFLRKTTINPLALEQRRLLSTCIPADLLALIFTTHNPSAQTGANNTSN